MSQEVSGGKTTLYAFPDFEIADDGTTTKSAAGGKQVCTTSGCQFFMYHREHLGSIQSITSSTAEVLHEKYKPFGDTHSTTGIYRAMRHALDHFFTPPPKTMGLVSVSRERDGQGHILNQF